MAHVPCTFAGAYPGLFLSTGPARMIRPVKQLFDQQAIEMIGPLEQVSLTCYTVSFTASNYFASQKCLIVSRSNLVLGNFISSVNFDS